MCSSDLGLIVASLPVVLGIYCWRFAREVRAAGQPGNLVALPIGASVTGLVGVLFAMAMGLLQTHLT